MTPQSIARATVNDVKRPRRVESLRDALLPHAAESAAVLCVASSRLNDMADHSHAITRERASRAVEEARSFVAAGGRVALAGWVVT